MQAEEISEQSEGQCPVHGATSSAVKTNTGTGERPPLIKAPPIIGPVRQFTGDVLPFLEATRKAYGDAFRMRMFGLEMTLLSGPDAIALLETDEILDTTKSMNVLMRAVKSRLPSTFDGPQHQLYRKMHHRYLNRALEREKRDEIVACLGKNTERWEPGHEFDALKESQFQTVDVLSYLLNGEPFPFTSKELSTVVHTLIFATYGHVPLWLVLNNPFYKKAQKRMNEHFLDLVARVRTNPELAANTLVGQYLDYPPPEGIGRWEDKDLKIVPLAAYLGGFDTVASAAAFFLYRLLSNPEVLQKVREEFQQLSSDSDGHVDPMNQKYLRAAWQETVRINPPGALVIRYATQDFEFAGYTIRKGDEVLIQISSDHMNEELFPAPTRFNPERFLGPDATTLKRHILPFGSGAHRCTGNMVGQLFSQEMISHWVNHFDLELVPGKDKPNVVARPFTQPLGLRVRVKGRRSG
jgi:pentalenene oxygenase